MKIKKIWNRILYALCHMKPPTEANTETMAKTFNYCCNSKGHGSKVTELPKGISLEELFLEESFEEQVAQRLAAAKQLQKTIIEWQKLAGIIPEKTLDLLIPIKEGKTERHRSVTFDSTPDMVAYLADKGFVPYDLDYIEEARTGKYRFIRIKKNEVNNFFEFPDATFNGPEFYTPYQADYSHSIVFGPYLAPHQLSNPVPITVQDIEAIDGKISVLSPLSRNRYHWEQKDGIYYPKKEEDFRDEEVEKECAQYYIEMLKKHGKPLDVFKKEEKGV